MLLLSCGFTIFHWTEVVQFNAWGGFGARDAGILWACNRVLPKRPYGHLKHQSVHLCATAVSKHLRQPSVQACSKAERHAGRLRLAKREELLSHEQHWAAPPFWLDGTEIPSSKASGHLLILSVSLAVQRLGRDWEVYRCARTSRAMVRNAKNRSLNELSEAPYRPLRMRVCVCKRHRLRLRGMC